MSQVATRSAEPAQASVCRLLPRPLVERSGDGEVIGAAQGRLRSCPYFSLRSLVLEFHEGVLVLRGKVASYYLKQVAQEAVRRVAGVEAIINVVEVIPAAEDAVFAAAAWMVSRRAEGGSHAGAEPETW